MQGTANYYFGINISQSNIDDGCEYFITADSGMPVAIFGYPVIFYVDIGTDRTGLITLLVNGMLGVLESDLYRDYLFSNFGKINSARSLSGIQKSYIATIKSYPGDTFSEQIKNCLVDLGIPEADLNSVISFLPE